MPPRQDQPHQEQQPQSIHQQNRSTLPRIRKSQNQNQVQFQQRQTEKLSSPSFHSPSRFLLTPAPRPHSTTLKIKSKSYLIDPFQILPLKFYCFPKRSPFQFQNSGGSLSSMSLNQYLLPPTGKDKLILATMCAEAAKFRW